MLLNEKNDDERLKLLEQIRKRAEDAELARIEAEEGRLTATLEDAASPFTSFSPDRKAGCTHHTIREQLVLAIKTNRFDDAAAAYDELLLVSPHDHQLQEFKLAIIEGRERIREEAAREEPNLRRSKKDELQRIGQLLQSAEHNYQSERYEEALKELDQVLELDPENADAVSRRVDVEKARLLEARVRQEEEQRRNIEAVKNESPLPLVSNSPAPEISKHRESLLEEEPNRLADQEPQPKPAEPPQLGRWRKLLRWFSYSVLLVLGLTACYVVYEHFREKIFGSRITLLVLPPRSSSVQPSLLDGLTDELVRNVSHLQGVDALSSATSFSFRSLEQASDAGSVGADYVLRWTIEKQSGNYAVQASVIDVKNGQQSGQSFASGLAEINQKSVQWLRSMFVPGTQPSSEKATQASTTPAAFEAYLWGRYVLSRRELSSLDSVASAFEQARKLDREFASTEVGLGWTNLLKFEAAIETSLVGLEQAKSNLLRAVNLGDKTSELYALWGSIEFHHSNYAEASRRFEQALAVSPSNSEAARRLSTVYLRSGKIEESIDIARLAVRTDPHGSMSRRNLAMLLLLGTKSADALREFEAERNVSVTLNRRNSDPYLAALVATNQPERGLDILRERVEHNPRDFIALYELGRMLQFTGKPKANWEQTLQKALNAIDDTLRVQPLFALAYSYRGLVQTRLGFFEEGIKSSSKALALSPNRPLARYQSARVFALQRTKEAEALRELERAVAQRFDLAELLDLDYTALRENPSFASILLAK